LASQYSFQRFRDEDDYPTIAELDTFVGEKPTPEEIHIEEDADLEPAPDPSDYGINREDAQPDPVVKQRVPEYKILDDDHEPDHIDAWNSMLAKAEKEITKEVVPDVMDERPGDYVSKPDTYVQNEEQSTGTTLWKEISGVTQSEYQAVAKEHQIYNFAEQVIAGELSIDDIIPSLREDVLAQVEKNKQDNLDQQFSIIEGLARQVMSGMLKIEQIPDDLRESVRARLNG
jgi:hypothetical protein